MRLSFSSAKCHRRDSWNESVVSLVCHRVISAAFRDAPGSKFASAAAQTFPKSRKRVKTLHLKQAEECVVSLSQSHRSTRKMSCCEIDRLLAKLMDWTCMCGNWNLWLTISLSHTHTCCRWVLAKLCRCMHWEICSVYSYRSCAISIVASPYRFLWKRRGFKLAVADWKFHNFSAVLKMGFAAVSCWPWMASTRHAFNFRCDWKVIKWSFDFIFSSVNIKRDLIPNTVGKIYYFSL
jgi:hypothetical protein